MKKVFRNLFVIAMSITAIATVSFVISSCSDDDDEKTEKEIDMASLDNAIIGIWQRQDNSADSTVYMTFKSSGQGTKTVIKKGQWGYETSFSYSISGENVAITESGKKVNYEVISLTNKKITMRNGVYLYEYYKVSSIPNYNPPHDCVCDIFDEGEVVKAKFFHIKDWTGDCADLTWKDMPGDWDTAEGEGWTLKCYEE